MDFTAATGLPFMGVFVALFLAVAFTATALPAVLAPFAMTFFEGAAFLMAFLADFAAATGLEAFFAALFTVLTTFFAGVGF
ncbi:MAG: hypothetical protein O9353_09490, partial [Bacteroidia bacterium]|nr:hypothetical protein [Bacteroidia bacterium]